MLINGAHVIIAAGVLSSVEIELEALDRTEDGWVVVYAYTDDLTPITTIVADSDVLDIIVEDGIVGVEVDANAGLDLTPMEAAWFTVETRWVEPNADIDMGDDEDIEFEISDENEAELLAA